MSKRKRKGNKRSILSTSKAAERRVAEVFGTRRTPLSGSNSGHTASDSLHPALFLEVKQRLRFAAWTLWDSTKKLARKEKKLPVLALDRVGSPGFLVVVHSDDLGALAEIVIALRQAQAEGEHEDN
jgi:hypothetical protein